MPDRPFGPVGIIDIGSNSVRLVAYGGSERVPSMLFNEKVMAGLGRGLAETGRISEAAMASALEALARFRLLAKEMKLKKLHAVATAAVRDASNGPEFLERAAAAGITPELIAGEEEARLSALGVISAIPHARGVVADLGGGSLELTPVADGAPAPGVSLPLGVLRVGEQASAKALATAVRKGVSPEILAAARDGNLYLVGGSFRAFAQLDLLLADHPLPIVHQHGMEPSRVRDLRNLVRATPVDELRRRFGLQSSRLQTLPAAAAILDALCRVFGPRRVVTSAFGLREGILYDDLSAERRQEDPLLAAALEVGERLGRFGDHGALLDRWIAPLFDDPPHHARLRLAACLLADVAWQAHPDFRAERGLEMALHGNWVGIDACGRVMIAQALFSNFGGGRDFPDRRIAALCSGSELACAARWGLAMRLGQRLSGGLASSLERSRLERDGDAIRLILPKGEEALYGETVERRLRKLAAALGCEPRFGVD